MNETCETCETCVFAKTSNRDHIAYCRLNPPQFTGNNDQGYPRFFPPVVTLDNFCRYWEGKLPEPAPHGMD